MLRAAVDDNVDVMTDRLPSGMRRGQRLLHRWPLPVWIAAASLAAGSTGLALARRPASAESLLPPVPVPGASWIVPEPLLLEAPLAAQPVPPDVLALGVRRVIVDAGHGGDNLGTASAAGLLEKHLTLDIADRVRQLIQAKGLEAVMTRTADQALSLRERAAIANGRRGDVFVSIHLNALRSAPVRGIETYYAGPSDHPEQDALAAAENQESGYSLSDMRSLLEKIYADARRNESRRLAESVQRALVDTLRRANPALSDRGVKRAPFVVLVATRMPAILAEVSCLSNAAEADRLGTAAYRQTIAEALVAGIEAFAGGAGGSRTERTGTRGS
jgi:N-acetylmuramoyl-L-alanine amidase